MSVVTSILPLSREDREVHRCGERVFRLGWQGAVSSRVGLALARASGARRSVWPEDGRKSSSSAGYGGTKSEATSLQEADA